MKEILEPFTLEAFFILVGVEGIEEKEREGREMGEKEERERERQKEREKMR